MPSPCSPCPPDVLRVLVVDDDPLYADAAEAILELGGGVEVVGRAANGREAVDLAVACGPDVVVLDVRMPVMDGFEAARRIRRWLPRARIVVVTTAPEPGDADRARAVGADSFLRKDPGTLHGAVVAGRPAAVEASAR